MKLLVNSLPQNIKSIVPLHYSKITSKSSTWDIQKSLSQSNIDMLWRMVSTAVKENGVGLAAPQVGLMKHLFIILNEDDNKNSYSAYFNPTFVKEGSNKISGIEGCLSVPNGLYEVDRYEKIIATWYEPESLEPGASFVRREKLLEGYISRVFQHEHQHLSGISIASVGKRIK